MKHKVLFIPAIAILLLSSCNSYKKLTYLQHIGRDADTLYAKKKTEYRLQSADILYVRIITMNDEVDRLFNPLFSVSGGSYYMRAENLYIMGYEITDSGYVELPILKKIHVEGLTVDQAKKKIQEKALEYLKDPQVIVKMHTFRFTILGEVNSPGVKEHGAHQINLMEALALGGDITYNGNRENILILHPTNEGTRIKRIDVTNRDLVATEDYFIQPNDIIYVEPLKTTLLRERTQDYLFYISAFTSILTAVALTINLVN